MPNAETAIKPGHPLTLADRALSGACALAAAADELVHSGPGLRVGDRRVVVAWLRSRAELLAAAADGAPRCAADDGWGRCFGSPVVDGYCPTHAAEDRQPADVAWLVEHLAAPWGDSDDVDDQVADQLAQLVVDDGCPACTADLTVTHSGTIVCTRGCDFRVDDDGSDLVVDDTGWARVGVAVVVVAWLAALGTWSWLMVLAWRAFIRWAAS